MIIIDGVLGFEGLMSVCFVSQTAISKKESEWDCQNVSEIN
jgi:hypothetical protein